MDMKEFENQKAFWCSWTGIV